MHNEWFYAWSFTIMMFPFTFFLQIGFMHGLLPLHFFHLWLSFEKYYGVHILFSNFDELVSVWWKFL